LPSACNARRVSRSPWLAALTALVEAHPPSRSDNATVTRQTVAALLRYVMMCSLPVSSGGFDNMMFSAAHTPNGGCPTAGAGGREESNDDRSGLGTPGETAAIAHCIGRGTEQQPGEGGRGTGPEPAGGEQDIARSRGRSRRAVVCAYQSWHAHHTVR